MKMWTYIKLTWYMASLTVLSQMEYRASFFIKIAGIVVNDLGLFLIWIIFFNRFPAINGWGLRSMLLLFALFLISFSLFAIFSAGTLEMAKLITRGELDYFLTLPKQVQWQISVSKSEFVAIGDLVLGVGMLFFAGPWTLSRALVFIVVSVLSAIVMYGFASIVQSLAFYFGNFEETADRWYWTLWGLSLYPQTIFSGPLKVIMLVLVPVFFVSSLPISLINNFSWAGLIFLATATLLFFLVSVWVFNKGLRRYESGNLINLRV